MESESGWLPQVVSSPTILIFLDSTKTQAASLLPPQYPDELKTVSKRPRCCICRHNTSDNNKGSMRFYTIQYRVYNISLINTTLVCRSMQYYCSFPYKARQDIKCQSQTVTSLRSTSIPYIRSLQSLTRQLNTVCYNHSPALPTACMDHLEACGLHFVGPDNMRQLVAPNKCF